MWSKALKERVTKEVDVAGPVKQLDIRGNVVVDVLIGADGSVLCAKGVYGHPMLVRAVEEAVRQWEFRPLKQGNTAIAYVGRLDFALCNISCGKKGPSITLLNQHGAEIP